MIVDYIRETQGKDFHFAEEGFCIYEINGDNIYLQDLYVKPHLRGNKYRNKLADDVAEIGRKNNCKNMTTTICVNLKTADRSKHIIEEYGFKFFKNENNMLNWYIKRL